MDRRRFLALLPPLLLLAKRSSALATPGFSGIWKQSNDRCVPKRIGEVVLRIEHHDATLVVETTAVRPSGQSRHAVQRYTTDGHASISTGADGDEFHTSIVWDGQRLLFSIEEHEDGRILLTKEMWTLMENETMLQRERESLDASVNKAQKQVLLYLRQSPQQPG